MPTMQWSTTQSLRKQPCEMMDLLTWQASKGPARKHEAQRGTEGEIDAEKPGSLSGESVDQSPGWSVISRLDGRPVRRPVALTMTTIISLGQGWLIVWCVDNDGRSASAGLFSGSCFGTPLPPAATRKKRRTWNWALHGLIADKVLGRADQEVSLPCIPALAWGAGSGAR